MGNRAFGLGYKLLFFRQVDLLIFFVCFFFEKLYICVYYIGQGVRN